MERKVCVVVTARASYARIKTALQAIAAHPDLELQLVVGASALLHNYGNLTGYIQEDGFEIQERVYMVLEGENPVAMAKTAGLGVIELATAFNNLRPDIVVTVADRYETMATALSASYMNIVTAHVQGGEVTGSIDEKVRHAVTKLADVHLVCTEKARERVIRMGEAANRVFFTGCPSIDLAATVLDDPELDFDPFERYGGVGVEMDLSDGYLVALQHPVTTEYADARRQVEETLAAVREIGLPTLWFWPNVDAGSDGTSEGIRAFREAEQPDNIHFFRHVEGLDFLKILYNARCLVGNSSVGIRECSFLGVPTVNIGTRQLGRERGENVIDVAYDRDEIEKGIRLQLESGRAASTTIYGDGGAGARIADLLATVELTVEKRLTY